MQPRSRSCRVPLRRRSRWDARGVAGWSGEVQQFVGAAGFGASAGWLSQAAAAACEAWAPWHVPRALLLAGMRFKLLLHHAWLPMLAGTAEAEAGA